MGYAQLESLTSDVKAKERAEGFTKDGEPDPSARKERTAVEGGNVSGAKKVRMQQNTHSRTHEHIQTRSHARPHAHNRTV